MDDHSKSQVKRLITQSPEYAAGFKAGREAGMREAADIANQHGSVEGIAQKIERAILSAIGGGK